MDNYYSLWYTYLGLFALCLLDILVDIVSDFP